MSQIIGIASGKGGVGKTWLTISLAHSLARRGRRVLLFDGDLGLANVDIQLGLEPGTDLGAIGGTEAGCEDQERLGAAGLDQGREGTDVGGLEGVEAGAVDQDGIGTDFGEELLQLGWA